MPLDPSRFVYSLAGRLIAGEWTLDQLQSVVSEALRQYGLRVPKLVERIRAAFVAKPAFGHLAIFLANDPGLRRAILRGPKRAVRTRAKKSFLAHPRIGGMDMPPTRLAGIVFPKLVSEADVARWLGIQPRRLRWLADIKGRNRKNPHGPLRTYRYRWIPRGDRFPRLLEIPKFVLKQVQRKILTEILDALPAHPAAHGFCTGRSIVTNAAVHCGKSTILRFDLTDFFPSITSARVFRIFRTIGYPDDVSRILTGLCTTSLPADVWNARPGAREGADFTIRQRLITRHLPQGAPTSAALANLAAHRLDRRLSGLARTAGAAYTRYADDLTFSGDADLARARKRLAAYVALVAHEEGFSLNFRKTRILRAGVRQHVTGVVVNVHPNIARAEFDRLKAILTNCVRHGPDSQNRAGVPDFQACLNGKVAHAVSINPARGEKLSRIFRQIVWNA